MSPAAWARRVLLLARRSTTPSQDLLYRRSYYSAAGDSGGNKKKKRVVAIVVISVADGVALSGINDLAIFHGCTRKAIQTATENREVVEAIGVPIHVLGIRGPWYDASVVLGHRRRSVSCTFPVTGPQGSGLFQIEAVRNGGDGVLSFLRHQDWEICAMDAQLEVASDNDDEPKKVTVNLVSSKAQSSGGECEAES